MRLREKFQEEMRVLEAEFLREELRKRRAQFLMLSLLREAEEERASQQ
jgi:hypothetical protein